MPIKSRHGGSISTRRIGANSGVPAARLAPHSPAYAAHALPALSHARRAHSRTPSLVRRFSRAVPLAPSHLHPPSLVPPFLSRLRTCTHRPLSRRFSRTCALTARTVLHRMTDPMPRSPAVHPHRPHAAHRPRRTVRARRTVRNRSSPRRSFETAGFGFLCKAIQTLWLAYRTGVRKT